MKNMRKFYENWIMLDSNSAVATAESSGVNSPITIGKLQGEDYQIDIYRSLNVDDIVHFQVKSSSPFRLLIISGYLKRQKYASLLPNIFITTISDLATARKSGMHFRQ